MKWRRDKKYPNYLTVAFGDCDMNGATRIELFWQNCFLAVFKPLHFGRMRQIALCRVPVVGAGVDGVISAAPAPAAATASIMSKSA